MARTWIKICGVRDVSTARAAAAAGADAVGLVFVDRSRRRVSIEQAKRVVEGLRAQAGPGPVEPVGLFVDAPPARVVETARAVGLRTVQLHGSEGPRWLSRLTRLLATSDLRGLRVVKALGFEAGRATQTLEPWRRRASGGRADAATRGVCEEASPALHDLTDAAGSSESPTSVPAVEVVALLWDAPLSQSPRGSRGTLPGGSGRRLDWQAFAVWRDEGGWHNLPPIILAGGLTPDNVATAISIVQPHGVDVSSGVESAPGVKNTDRIRAFCHAVRQAEQPAR